MGEVAFQAGCQAADVRVLLADSLRAPQKKLAAMHARVKKHLGATAPALAAAVWARLQARPAVPRCVCCLLFVLVVSTHACGDQ